MTERTLAASRIGRLRSIWWPNEVSQGAKAVARFGRCETALRGHEIGLRAIDPEDWQSFDVKCEDFRSVGSRIPVPHE
jgi:hypothetical protein